MRKKIKYRNGDIIGIPIANKKVRFGRVIKKYESTIFIEIYKYVTQTDYQFDQLIYQDLKEIALKVWCYDENLVNGNWRIIGHNPVDHSFIMPDFWTEGADGKYYIIPGTDCPDGDTDQIREVEREEIGGELPYGVCHPEFVEEMCSEARGAKEYR